MANDDGGVMAPFIYGSIADFSFELYIWMQLSKDCFLDEESN